MSKRKQSTIDQIKRIWSHLAPRRKRQILLLTLLMIFASFAEMVSIGSVLPFLGVLVAPEKIFFHAHTQPLVQLLGLQSPEDLLLPFTLVLIVAAILAGVLRITLLWGQLRLSMAIGADLSVQVYERTLHQPYSFHVSHNSSEILAGSQKANDLVWFIIQPTLFILSSMVILTVVIATLLYIEPVMAIATFLGFGLIYSVVVIITKSQIAKNSQVISLQQGKVTKAIQEGLGGIRDVIIDGTQSVYSKLYSEAILPLQLAMARNQVVGGSPRFGIEALGVVLLAGLAYGLAAPNVLGEPELDTIPILGAIALGAQRLLPVLQQLYGAYITIKGNHASTEDALVLLGCPVPARLGLQAVQPMVFRRSIALKDLCFRYSPHCQRVLSNINLEIPKGSRFGFFGTTGSGKSTLLDIVMGLLSPTEGKLIIDEITVTSTNVRAWQANVAHVPQVIFLSDSSIAENIAFGVPKGQIDLVQVRQAAAQAQISQTIEGWSNGYDTLVGERGVRLSGGQRQRIGIARALYKHANVLIFDEATSALDNGTESAVIAAVEAMGRDITILMIAHRITTLKICDRVVEIKNGAIAAIKSYEEININVEEQVGNALTN